jgi:hypothetical protein
VSAGQEDKTKGTQIPRTNPPKKVQSCHKSKMARPYICLKNRSMETQEQILKEQRLKIETLRYRILLRYYELLLTLDVMTQPNEVKTLMGYINTLERYAKKYETKPVKKKSGKRKEHIDEIPVTDENTGSKETDYMPDNPSNLFDLLEDSDETYPPEADVLPTDIDDFLRAGYARYLKQKENKEKNNPAHPQLEDSQP